MKTCQYCGKQSANKIEQHEAVCPGTEEAPRAELFELYRKHLDNGSGGIVTSLQCSHCKPPKLLGYDRLVEHFATDWAGVARIFGLRPVDRGAGQVASYKRRRAIGTTPEQQVERELAEERAVLAHDPGLHVCRVREVEFGGGIWQYMELR